MTLPTPPLISQWNLHNNPQLQFGHSHEPYNPFHPIINITPTQTSWPQSFILNNNHSFTSKIMAALLTPHFKPPNHIDQHDGITNPKDHHESLQTFMLLSRAPNPIMCQAFSTTLKKANLRWFTTLPTQLISNFKQLDDAFCIHFSMSQAPKKTYIALVNFQQGK